MADSIKRYLSDLNVEFISLVDAGANRKTLIYKNFKTPDGKRQKVQPTLEIRKTDEGKHLIYCVVYAPDQVDTDGDGMKAEDIEKAAHAFMKASRNDRVDKQHNEQADQGHVVESWIVRKNDQLFTQEEGAWAVAIKVADEDTWQAVKAGEITGVSMQGRCKASEVEAKAESEDGLFKRFMKAFMGSREGAEAQSEYETMSAKKEQVLKLISQFETYVKQLKKETKSFNPTIMSEKREKSEVRSQEQEEAKKKKENEQHEDFSKVLKSALDEAFEPVNDKLDVLEARLETLEKSAPGQAGEQGRGQEDSKKKASKGLKIL